MRAGASLGFLIGARVVQAIGGSMLNPVAMSIIRNVFVDARERAHGDRRLGRGVRRLDGARPGARRRAGRLSSWRAVFIVNIPVGLIAIVLTALFVPESKRATAPRRIDPVGQVLVIAALATLTYGIIDAPRAGWGSTSTLILFAVLAGRASRSLIPYELRRRQPLIQVRFFRSAPFAGATAIAVGMFAGIGGFLFLNTLYLQNARGPVAA